MQQVHLVLQGRDVETDVVPQLLHACTATGMKSNSLTSFMDC